HMNRTEQYLRQQQGDEARARNCCNHNDQRGSQPLIEIAADEQRRHADADRPELFAVQQQRLSDLENLAAFGVHRADECNGTTTARPPVEVTPATCLALMLSRMP